MHLLVGQVKSHIGSYPCPLNINFMWNFGFMLSIMYIIQIFTGLVLSIHYSADVNTAFYSISYILREVGSGWLFRYLHSNGASFIFLFMYLHMFRSLIFKSYLYLPNAWMTGIIMYILSIGIAFLGYVLPWGQMSFWAATVITNLISSIPVLYKLICGGYYVCGPTIKRFFVLHFILPIICICIAIVHIYYIHLHGSNNPLGVDTNLKISFYPNVLLLDAKGLNIMLLLLIYQYSFGVLVLSHSDNSEQINKLLTPMLIVPEWYFLPFYGLLKVIPNKECGLLLFLLVIQALLLLAEGRALSNSMFKWYDYRTTNWSIYMLYSMYGLLVVGAAVPQDIYLQHGRIFFIYWVVFMILIMGGLRDERCVPDNIYAVIRDRGGLTGK